MKKKKKKRQQSTETCLCGTKQSYANCCGLYLDGLKPAPSAEALMRSRYSAYVLKNADYLLKTWHPETRPAHLDFSDNPAWLRLKILETLAGQAEAVLGSVHFIAFYKINGQAQKMEENSSFEKMNGQWFYVQAAS
ncbi:YchJ family metal-binding protein [Candidatus Venteria ishoeyi]|nr:YchJ family metal-binding protein [Candidatus Venteria ishoeyi]MDM8546465.1 YchJ family metal-binding protein [Candidatus Venteria ishoeyi]